MYKLGLLSIVIGFLISCEETPDVEIISPNESTTWNHWMYNGSIEFKGFTDGESAAFFIVNPEGILHPLETISLDLNSVKLKKPVNPSWGAGDGFRVGATEGANDTIFSSPFTIERLELPNYDVAKVLTIGTKYYYTQNTDGILEYWQEEVIKDTILGGVNYSVVSGFGWRHKPYQRADTTVLYVYMDGEESVLYDLNLNESLESRTVFGFEVPTIRVGIGDATSIFSKYFGQIYYDIFNMQWMENSWSLSAVLIDGEVYGDTTQSAEY